MLGKLLAGVLVGFLGATLAYLLFGLVFAQSPHVQSYSGPIPVAVLWIAMVALALTARTAGKAWRYLLVLDGLLAFALPFIAFVAAGMHMDSDLARHIGDAIGSVLGAQMLTAHLGTYPAEIAGVWIPAANSELLGLALLSMGTLLLCLGLMVGTVPCEPMYRDVERPLPSFANVIRAKGGTLKFRVLAYRPMSDEEVMTTVWDALEDGQSRQASRVSIRRARWFDNFASRSRFMPLTCMVFVGHDAFASATRRYAISKPRALIGLRGGFVGAFGALTLRRPSAKTFEEMIAIILRRCGPTHCNVRGRSGALLLQGPDTDGPSPRFDRLACCATCR